MSATTHRRITSHLEEPAKNLSDSPGKKPRARGARELSLHNGSGGCSLAAGVNDEAGRSVDRRGDVGIGGVRAKCPSQGREPAAGGNHPSSSPQQFHLIQEGQAWTSDRGQDHAECAAPRSGKNSRGCSSGGPHRERRLVCWQLRRSSFAEVRFTCGFGEDSADQRKPEGYRFTHGSRGRAASGVGG
jgi:hypothetical protein